MAEIELEQMLARRGQVAEEMTGAAARLGVLYREELELVGQIRRRLERSGISAQPFGTRPDVEELVSSELGRAGLQVWRVAAPWGPRLTELVERQNGNVRALAATKAA